VSVELLVAPAAAGKTAYLLALAREAAGDLAATPRIIVPGYLQLRAWRRRLAEAGGAIGVRLMTFSQLYAECLGAASETYTELAEPVQYRLLRAIVDELPLTHYAPLTDRPGFVQLLQAMIGELKAGMILPEAFAGAVSDLGGEPRLVELAQVYAAYQARLQAQGWADRAGLGWLAVEALAERAPHVGRDWPLLVVDGFDSLTPVQLELLKVLSGRVGEMLVTLTGTGTSHERPLVHQRFDRTRLQLEAALGVKAQPLPQKVSHHAAALAHLEANLFAGGEAQVPDTGAVELVEAPGRDGEVRAALRWLKARLVQDGMRPGDVALLARSVAPYRSFILGTAVEFGLPIRLADGLPLATNPAVAALLDLLRLMLPGSQDDPQFRLPRRPVVEAWRSPYFDWSALPAEGAAEPIGIAPEDADTLDLAARWGRVIGGLAQWNEVLNDLAARGRGEADDSAQDEERGLPPGIPLGPAAGELRARFGRFTQRLTPPPGKQAYRAFVGWLEALIGPDPDHPAAAAEPTALQVVARARAAADESSERDVAALQALKDVLRGLVWAEEALGTPPVDYARFLSELTGAVEATAYLLPVRPEREEILVADVIQARGVPFRVAALLGLAEGEFPAALAEDPLLRDADRDRLRENCGLPLELSTESAEAEFFYEAVTRPREQLLLTRPRLADNGAPWQASPFWEEVRRLVAVEPVALTSESLPTPHQAASWPELMESLASHPGYGAVRGWVLETEPERQVALDAGAYVLRLRRRSAAGDPFGSAQDGLFDGELSDLADTFADRFGAGHDWSASRLEAYRACPFSFFVGSVLALEPRQEPAEGLDARQLGNIYHRIFESLYQAPDVTDPADLDQLLGALEGVAGPILDQAPSREGFQETAWWDQTRVEIIENVRLSLMALAEMPGGFVPYRHEAVFGLHGRPPLVLVDGDDSLRLRGFIDRVDRAPDGRLRVIDYKTGGPSPFTNKAITEGKKLQLPLYALAARDALGLGDPAEGFYWHVRQAKPSGFSLGGYPGGYEEALRVAVEKAWEAVRGARAGRFVPHPPGDGCPSYCPAVAFCWHYRPGRRG
jgi:ATP-dependent helicase/DNAse subunit B